MSRKKRMVFKLCTAKSFVEKTETLVHAWPSPGLGFS